MNYRCQINHEGLITLPDMICNDLGIEVGDVLICEAADNASKLVLRKHTDQTLTDDEIALAGNLTRVIPLKRE